MRQRYLQSLGIPAALVDRMVGKSPVPDFKTAGGDGVPYPPAFTPLWGDVDSSIGIWFHWFVNRKLSYVRLFHEIFFLCLETARNHQQFLEDLLKTEIEKSEGVKPYIGQMAKEFGISNDVVDFIDRFTLECDVADLLPCFQVETPLAEVPSLDKYEGEFPTVLLAHRHHWDSCCEIEARGVLAHHHYKKEPLRFKDDAAAWQAHVEVSPWLSEGNHKPDVFKHYIQKGDWGKAWLTLNAHGWKLSEVSDALHELNRRTRAPGFDLAVDSWHESLALVTTVRDYY